MTPSLRDYYTDWEGWSCTVLLDENGNVTLDDEKGDCCGEVIENTRKSMMWHLIEKHGMDKEKILGLEL